MSLFKDKSEKELQKILGEKNEALRVFRFEMAGSKIKNVKTGRLIKKDIARILTEMATRKKIKVKI